MILVLWLACVLGQDPGTTPVSPDPATPARPGHVALITAIDTVEVPAREMGILKKIHVREGENVAAGQLLAEIDAAEAELGVRKAREELEIAQAQAKHELKLKVARLAHAVAEAELTRAVESNKKFADAVSATELDQLRLSRDKAQAEIEHAGYELTLAALSVNLKSTELAAAEQALERRRVFAPIAGKVVEVPRRPGEWTQPGEKLFHIVNSDRVRAECLLSAREFPDDLTGAPVSAALQTKSRDAHFEGRVTFVDPEINAVNGQFRIWAEFDNPGRVLRPGHRVLLTVPDPSTSPPPETATP